MLALLAALLAYGAADPAIGRAVNRRSAIDVEVTSKTDRAMKFGEMHLLRAFFARRRGLAMLLVAAALCMKALVPAGYMIGKSDRILTVEICADSQGSQLTKQIVIPGDGQSHGNQNEHAKSDGTCAFSALSFASLSAADPALLAIALIFILALGFVPVNAPRPMRQFHLRPPLRGPPALV